MRTLPPSLRPPPSGAAVRGFAAVASCYDVKTTSPLPSPSNTLPAARHLTPDLLSSSWHPVRVRAGVPPPRPTTLPPFSAAERERAKTLYKILGNFPPKKTLPNLSSNTNTVHAQLTLRCAHTHLNTPIYSSKNVTTFLVCGQWTNHYYKEGYVKCNAVPTVQGF